MTCNISPKVDISRVMTLCALMTSLLCGTGDKPAVDFSMDQARLQPLITTVFVFSFVWSVGGNLVEKSMDAFDSFCRDLFSDNHDVKVSRIPTFTTHLMIFYVSFLCRFLEDLIFTIIMWIWRVSVWKYGRRLFLNLHMILRFVNKPTNSNMITTLSHCTDSIF